MKIVKNTCNRDVALAEVRSGSVIQVVYTPDGSERETVIAVVTRRADPGHRTVVDLRHGRVLSVDAATAVQLLPDAVLHLTPEDR